LRAYLVQRVAKHTLPVCDLKHLKNKSSILFAKLEHTVLYTASGAAAK
jgi:hypothetical protein